MRPPDHADYTPEHATCSSDAYEVAEANLVRNRILYFWQTQGSPHEKCDEKHRADAREQRRTRGAQNANSLCLAGYGFFTSVAV